MQPENARLILDTSITAEWALRSSSPTAMQLADTALEHVHRHGALIPPLWHCEHANVMAMALRRGKLTEDELHAVDRMQQSLNIETDEFPLPDLMPTLRRLAREHRLTVYDAAYLELAQRHGLLLATLDVELAAAAQALRIPLLQLD